MAAFRGDGNPPATGVSRTLTPDTRLLCNPSVPEFAPQLPEAADEEQGDTHHPSCPPHLLPLGEPFLSRGWPSLAPGAVCGGGGARARGSEWKMCRLAEPRVTAGSSCRPAAGEHRQRTQLARGFLVEMRL